jgi:hypothetical protein
MAQKPLVEGRQGVAPLVHARLIPADFDRVSRLAEMRGISRSQFIRDAIRDALDATETGQSNQTVA